MEVTSRVVVFQVWLVRRLRRYRPSRKGSGEEA